ncbi:peptidylprolyl isomerase, partial [Chloroflexota bacterium]
LLVCFSLVLAGCGTQPAEPVTPPSSPTFSPEKTDVVVVKDGDTVKVHYTGTLEDGTVFDSSVEREPLEFTLGAGEMIPGFEEAIMVMQVGQSKTVTIPADEAYGPHLASRILLIEREQLPEELNPEVGQRLQMRQTEGPTIPVIVTEVLETAIVADANHPLAGKDLTFAIELLEIK